MSLLEKDMEDLIIENPQKYLDEPDLKLISRQYSIGNYRFDLLFEDRHGAKLIVEIQRGTLDRNHTYKIFDYFDEFKNKNPHEFIELMVVANKIPRERRNRLKSHGVSFKEVPESIFLEDLAVKGTATPIIPSVKTAIFSDSNNNKERFEKLLALKSWHDECSGKSEITPHRLEQLGKILQIYEGLIPYSHFNINERSLRNSQIYPVICAYHAGYFVVEEQGLSLKQERKKELSSIYDNKNTLIAQNIFQKFLEVFDGHEGEVFSRSKIIELICVHFPDTNPSSLIPSDYCYNLFNKGINFKKHIFEQVDQGAYKYLGQNASYTGKVFWSKNDHPVGEWLNGVLTQDPLSTLSFNHPLIVLIRELQPQANYIQHLDTIEKIEFIESVHSLLSSHGNVERTFNKKEMTYTHGTKFGCIVPQKQKIVVGPLLVRFEEINDPQQICRDIRGKRYSSGGEVRADFREPYSDPEYAVFLLKQSLAKT